jgi:hypothetical protein
MSTILRALKKAEESRARETLPGKILPDERLQPRTVARMPLIIGVSLIVCVCAAAVLVQQYFWNRSIRLSENHGTFSPPGDGGPVRGELLPVSKGVARDESLPPKLHLSGILWDESQPLAIINGTPSKMGAEIEGATVVKIDRNSVQVRYNQKILTLIVE